MLTRGAQTRGAQCLLVLSLLLWSGAARAQTKMTIATGVDPVFSAYYVAQQEGLFKKLGVARGSGGEVFWLALIDKLKLNPADYTVVNVEAPEMVAALERGNIDAYAVWEPWVTRGLAAVKNTKVLRDQEGILEQGVYIYMNLAWIRKNPEQAEGFMRALVEATDIINKDRKRAAKDVSDFLKSLDPPLVEQLMTKLRFEMVLDDFTISLFRLAETQLKQQGKLTKPLDFGAFVYPDLLRKVQPKSVNYKP